MIYAMISWCYVRLKLMFSDIFRTGKAYVIFTFKDTKTWGRLTPIGSRTCWGLTSSLAHLRGREKNVRKPSYP